MAMTGQKVAGGFTVGLIAMSSLQTAGAGQKISELLDLSKRLAGSWGAPLVPLFPQVVEDGALLSVGLLRVQQAGEMGADFTVAVAFLGQSADASLPDAIVAAVPWSDLAQRHATPLDAGQRASGRFPRPRMS